MQVVQTGLSATPQSSMLHRTLGLLLERSGKPGDAAQAYRDYVRLAPNAPDAQELAARASRLEKRAGTTSS
jgi:cytochrome c-type biogenesis protein CcmH/NrfG